MSPITKWDARVFDGVSNFFFFCPMWIYNYKVNFSHIFFPIFLSFSLYSLSVMSLYCLNQTVWYRRCQFRNVQLCPNQTMSKTIISILFHCWFIIFNHVHASVFFSHLLSMSSIFESNLVAFFVLHIKIKTRLTTEN